MTKKEIEKIRKWIAINKRIYFGTIHSDILLLVLEDLKHFLKTFVKRVK